MKPNTFKTQKTESFFKTPPYWENTGGHVMVQCLSFTNEFVELLSLTGEALTISDEGVSVHSSIDSFLDGTLDSEKEHLQSNEVAEASPVRFVLDAVLPCLKQVNITKHSHYYEQETLIHFESGYELILHNRYAFINFKHELKYVFTH